MPSSACSIISSSTMGWGIVHLHADNCGGQNKNAALEGDDWATQRDHSIIHGHTKFSPDWCFGLLKKKYRRTKVDGLTDLVSVVNDSASSVQRQWYLNKIREFVSANMKDRTCPKPAEPQEDPPPSRSPTTLNSSPLIRFYYHPNY